MRLIFSPVFMLHGIVGTRLASSQVDLPRTWNLVAAI